MTLQINAIELAAELAHKALIDRHNTIRNAGGFEKHSEDFFFENESYKPLYQDEFNQLCDEYMELITNSQTSDLDSPIKDGYYPISHLHKEDLIEKGYDVRGLEDEDMKNIAQRLGEAYNEFTFPEDLVTIADIFEVPKLKENEK